LPPPSHQTRGGVVPGCCQVQLLDSSPCCAAALL